MPHRGHERYSINTAFATTLPVWGWSSFAPIRYPKFGGVEGILTASYHSEISPLNDASAFEACFHPISLPVLPWCWKSFRITLHPVLCLFEAKSGRLAHFPLLEGASFKSLSPFSSLLFSCLKREPFFQALYCLPLDVNLAKAAAPELAGFLLFS